MKIFYFIYEFFYWLGIQNDYNYPSDENYKPWHPYPKKHLWKTRIGFKTAWNIAKFVTFN